MKLTIIGTGPVHVVSRWRSLACCCVRQHGCPRANATFDTARIASIVSLENRGGQVIPVLRSRRHRGKPIGAQGASGPTAGAHALAPTMRANSRHPPGQRPRCRLHVTRGPCLLPRSTTAASATRFDGTKDAWRRKLPARRLATSGARARLQHGSQNDQSRQGSGACARTSFKSAELALLAVVSKGWMKAGGSIPTFAFDARLIAR